MDTQRRIELFNQGYWEVPDNLDTSNFDFSWRPDPYDRPYTHQFGTQWQKTGGPRFVIPESEGTKYQTHQHCIRLRDESSRAWRNLKSNISFDYSWHPDDNDPPYIYVFGNQWYDSKTMPTVQYRVKGATEKKYVEDIRARLLPSLDRWESPDDIKDFDYSWVPHPYDPPNLNYQFGTQWQKTGGPIYNSENGHIVKYVDIQRATKKSNRRNWRVLENIDDSTFDFSWHPDSTEDPYKYVFGNDCYSPELMPTVLYSVKGATVTKPCTDIVPKLTNVETVYYEDTVYDAVTTNMFNSKYVHFAPKNSNSNLNHNSLLKESNGTFYIHNVNDVEFLVHREAKNYIYDKLTDYQYIKYHDLNIKKHLLDIIFVSNGESCAEDNYKHLLSLNLPNRIVRVDGVDGRVASQRMAANMSETPWYFLVNAKLKVDENFDFTWQPDIMKSRRHYIFKAKNPINNLVYGHMAIVANNKKLTLETHGNGLDFTMEKPHEVIDMLSGEAVFNSEWDVWRTSFRECLKLKKTVDDNPNDIMSVERLKTWATVSGGEYGEFSIEGALDAIEYYDSVHGEFDKLKLSYDWSWLKDYYNEKSS